MHSLDGRYLGNVPLTDGLLQLCDTTETIANAAYVFGTYYKYSVSRPPYCRGRDDERDGGDDAVAIITSPTLPTSSAPTTSTR